MTTTAKSRLPLTPMDGTDWSHTVATDVVRIGRITATRTEWIEALHRLNPAIPRGDAADPLDTPAALSDLEALAVGIVLGYPLPSREELLAIVQRANRYVSSLRVELARERIKAKVAEHVTTEGR